MFEIIEEGFGAKIKIIGEKNFEVEGVDFVKNDSESLKDADVIFVIGNENTKKFSETAKNYDALKIAIVEEEIVNLNVDSYFVVDDKSLAEKIIRAIADLVAVPGLVNLDIVDVKSILEGSGKSYVKVGESSGKNAAVKAIKSAIDSSLKNAKGILLNILGATDSVSMMEVNEASIKIQEAAHEDAEIIWGVSIDESVGDKVFVTIIATKF